MFKLSVISVFPNVWSNNQNPPSDISLVSAHTLLDPLSEYRGECHFIMKQHTCFKMQSCLSYFTHITLLITLSISYNGIVSSFLYLNIMDVTSSNYFCPINLLICLLDQIVRIRETLTDGTGEHFGKTKVTPGLY